SCGICFCGCFLRGPGDLDLGARMTPPDDPRICRGSARITPHIAEIQYAVAERFGVPMMEMVSDRRARRVARPRQVAMYLSRELTPMSLPGIGKHFGGRDHTTIMH